MFQFDFPQLELDGESVFHYTSGNALSGILQKDKIVLWLTHADYLNDTTEGKGIFTYLNSACQNLLKQGKLSPVLYKKILVLEITLDQSAKISTETSAPKPGITIIGGNRQQG